MPVGNEILRGRALPRIEGTLLCRRCGYDLKGIDPAGRCPECGVVIKRDSSRRRLGDTITDAPTAYLNFLGSSCWIALATSVTSIGVFCAAMVMDEEIALLLIWSVSSLCWVGAVFLLTADRQSVVVERAELKREWRKSRWFARLSQIAWVVAAGLSAWQLHILLKANPGIRVFPGWAVTPKSIEFISIGIGLSYLVGLVGIGFLCFHLASLAYWAQDESLERRLRTCAYFLCGGVPLLIFGYQFQHLTGMLGVIAFGAFLLMLFAVGSGWVMFLVGLGQLAMLSVWAIESAKAESDRDMRMVARVEAERKVAMDREYAAPPPVDLRPSGGETKAGKPKGAYVERPSGVEGYEVRESGDR